MKIAMALLAAGSFVPVHAYAETLRDGLPTKMSDISGWHGIRLDSQPAHVCRMVFPGKFGLEPDEYRFLLAIVRQGDIKKDMDCSILRMNQAAWIQLRRLAVEFQNHDAARLIVSAMLRMKDYYILDGEYGEEFGANFVYPVLIAYDHPREIVSVDQEKDVAEMLCISYYATEDHPDLSPLEARLKQRHMVSFVRKLKKECDKIR